MTLSVEQEEGLRAVQDSQAQYIIGIDEVGLGSCAGPLTVCGAVFPKGWGHPEVKDSKAFKDSKDMTAHQKRNSVFSRIIYPQALFYYVHSVSAEDVDSMSVETALCDASRAVYMACLGRFPDALVVMDGTLEHNIHKDVLTKAIAFPKADALVPAVSAASIIAKVVRDEYMVQADRRHPGYGFAKHKGYPTPAHRTALKQLGVCDEHRRSYKVVAAVLGRWQAFR
jgi:ribonuclease HII